jgi:hypothetical protein
MTHKFFSVQTPEGGSYNIELSSFDDSSFPKEVANAISPFIDVVNIDLTRARKEKAASIRTLSIITSRIAEYFLERKNLVICYYCDFLGPIPHTNKKITCQAYGVEDYFVHIIYRQQHEKYVDLIANSIHEGYDKP